MKMFQQYGSMLFGDRVNELAETAQFVDISNVAHWFYEDTEKDLFDIRDDFPSIVSPWPLTWMEYRFPRTMRIGNEVRSTGAAGGIYIGALLLSIPLKDGRDALEQDVALEFCRIGFAASGKQMPKTPSGLEHDMSDRREALNNMLAADELPRWMLQATIMQEISGRKALPVSLTSLYLDENGRAFQRGIIDIAMPMVISGNMTYDTGFAVFAFALSLMHCKNVNLEDIPVPPKIQAKREKRGVPTVTFKTLVVEPMRQQVRREAAEDPAGEQNHIKRAMHIARGHFKDYRNGPGLFGKYQGLYWWDMHVRGSAEVGTVVKDYKVKV